MRNAVRHGCRNHAGPLGWPNYIRSLLTRRDSMRLPLLLQDLPPAAARFCLGIERFTRQRLGMDLRGKSLLVALSGGADSTALLCCLHYLSPRLGARILSAHVDHGLRPGSDQDLAFCRELCATLSVPLCETRLNVAELAQQGRTGIEEAGREARYGFFRKILTEEGLDLLLTAHHLNDLAEDALMRLIRGTGWPELAGMPAYDPERRLLRPLLLTPGAGLRDFLSLIGASWREDPSNDDLSFLRNRVRHSILPLFLRENPNFLESIARLWRMAALDREFFDGAKSGLDIHHDPERNDFRLPLANLQNLHPAVRMRVYKALLDALGPGQALWENVLRLEEAVSARRTGAVIEFPGDKQMIVEHGALICRIAAKPST